MQPTKNATAPPRAPPTRQENLNRMRCFSQVLFTMMKDTDAVVDDSTSCAACEVAYPFMDPAFLVKRGRRDRSAMFGLPKHHPSLRGMYLEVVATSEVALKTADRLHDLYFEPSLLAQLGDHIVEATLCFRDQRRRGSALAMLRRYGKLAKRAFKETGCMCDTNIGKDEWMDVFDATGMKSRCVKRTLRHSVEYHPDFFIDCVERVRDKNADVTKPFIAELLVVMYESTLDYAQIAIRAHNWGALKAIAESPSFGHDKCIALSVLGACLSKRTAMLMVIVDVDPGVIRDHADALVDALITDDVPTEEVYVCAAECVGLRHLSVARRLIEVLRARGGLRRASDYGRNLAMQDLYVASGGSNRLGEIDQLVVVRDIFEQIKMPLTEKEASRLERVRVAISSYGTETAATETENEAVDSSSSSEESGSEDDESSRDEDEDEDEAGDSSSSSESGSEDGESSGGGEEATEPPAKKQKSSR